MKCCGQEMRAAREKWDVDGNPVAPGSMLCMRCGTYRKEITEAYAQRIQKDLERAWGMEYPVTATTPDGAPISQGTHYVTIVDDQRGTLPSITVKVKI